MTAPNSGPDPTRGGPSGSGGDPSMEDILASIRRILSEDEGDHGRGPQQEGTPGEGRGEPRGAPEVLPLDPSMLVDEPQAASPPAPRPAVQLSPPPPQSAAPAPPPAQPAPERVEPAQPGSLLAPEAAAAAASAVGSLVRTLASERTTAVRSGGPTIEDLVREELRPLLKQWLDANLPPLVERLVRAEIERVVGRALS
jgi:cell pole-organizing protein PopZ